MNARILGLTFFILGLAGLRPALYAADEQAHSRVVLSYGILEPSAALAERFQKRGDYETAVLINEAILERDPTDRQALRRMVECHEAQVKKERPEEPAAVQPPKPESDDGLSDLPNLIAGQPANAQKPKEDPRHRLL